MFTNYTFKLPLLKLKDSIGKFKLMFIAFFAFMLFCISASAHTWEIRVKQNANGTLTWYGQSYHGVGECGISNSGININGVNYNWTAEFSGSVVPLSAYIFTASPQYTTCCNVSGRVSYGTVTTPFIPGNLTVTAYSTNACYALYPDMPAGGGVFNPPPPACTTCPLINWNNTVGTANNNGTPCNISDDFIPVTITVNHQNCAKSTGNGQFTVVNSSTNATIGSYVFNAISPTVITYNAPVGTSNNTQINISTTFPCNVQQPLAGIPNGTFSGIPETTPPTINCPANISVNASSAAGAVVNYAQPVGTDNCPGAITTRIAGLASGATFPIGTTTVTYRVTDGVGLTALCSFNVTVNSAVPVIICPSDITVNNVPGQCGAIVSFTATETTAIPASTITYSHLPGSFFPVGTTMVTATATNAVGSSTCTFNVTVVDNENPVITCGANITHTADAGVCSYSFIPAPATATDNCPGVTVAGVRSDALAMNAPYPVGTTTITWTATDAYVLTASCTQTVTVTDNEQPTIVCAANQILNLNATCAASLPDYRSMLTVSDNCTPQNALIITQIPAPGTAVNGTGTLTVTFTVTDASNNSTSCSITITKRDATPPTITCPQPVTVNSTPNQCGAIVNFSLPAASDNCSGSASGGVHVLNNGDQFFDYANNRFEIQNSPGLPLTFNPTDGTKMAVFLQSCGSTHFMYQDVTLPASGSIQLGFDLQYKNHFAGGFSTNQFLAVEIRSVSTNAILQTLFKTNPGDPLSTPMTHYSYNLSAFAGQTVRLEIIDATINNFYFDILLDNVTITGSSLVNGSFETGNYNGWTIASSNGQCGTFGIGSGLGVALTQTAGLSSGSVFPVGTTTNTFVATDASGNTATCSFNVTVVDNQSPTITCPADIAVYATSAAGATATYIAPVGADNCPGSTTVLTAGFVSGSTFPIGTTTVTYTVTDASGNTAACSFTVTVTGIAPQIVCPANITVNNDEGQCGAIVNFAATETVAIPASTITYSQNPGTFFPTGTTIVTATAVNAVGSSTCTFTVTVNDTETPTITCNAPIVVTNDEGACGAAVNYVVTSTDNCPGQTIAQTAGLPSGSFFPKGTTTNTFVVTDASGNAATCSFTVTVNDTEAPTITCNAPIVVSNDEGACGAVVPYTVTSTDNCEGQTIAQTAGLPSGSFFPKGTTTNTFVVTDASGNTATCSFTVTVNDTENPGITCPADVTVNCQDDNSSASTGTATATDNCTDTESIIITQTQTSTQIATGAGHYNYVISRTWRATDESGNFSECTQTITVRDITAPVAICNPITITLVNGAATITASGVNNGSNDNCSPVTLSVSKTDFNCTNIGNNIVTLTVTDVSGNSSTCTAIVTVVGEIPSCSITAIPGNNIYTGGVPTNLYLGYGPQTLTLQVNVPASGAPYTYAWSGGILSNYNTANPVFTAATAGLFTYTVLVTNKYGCVTTCMVSICVKDIRVPGSPANNIKVYVCHNGNTISISTNAVASHIPGHSGDRLGSCSDLPCATSNSIVSSRGTAVTETVIVTAQPVELAQADFKVNVYPNPSAYDFSIQVLSKSNEPVTVRILDINGKVRTVQTQITKTNSIKVGASLVGGTYFAEITQGSNKQVVKLVKLN